MGVIPASLTSSIFISYTMGLAADQVSQIMFTAPVPLRLTGISEVHNTADSSGTPTLQFQRCQGVEAVTEGDDLLATALDMDSTAATVVNVTLDSDFVNFEAGDRLVLEYGGDAATELAGVTITARFTARQ